MGLTVFPLSDLQPVRVLSMHRWKYCLPAAGLAPQQPFHSPFGFGVTASYTNSEYDELLIVCACANPAGFRLRASPLRLGDCALSWLAIR